MRNEDGKRSGLRIGKGFLLRGLRPGAVAVACISLCLVFQYIPVAAGVGNSGTETGSNASDGSDKPEKDSLPATASNGLMAAAGIGDLWENRVGDMSFLSGSTGTGTEEKPYEISTKAQLMGLADLASRGMVIKEGEGTWPGDYAGACFRMSRSIDLGGMEWLPIGYYRTAAEMDAGWIHPFRGHFDGGGYVISNFRMYYPSWDHIGFFGAVEDSEIRNLTLKPGYVLTAKDKAGLLAGSVKNSRIYHVTVTGTMKTTGTAGGVAGELSQGSTAENVTADHVAIDGGREKETYIGGISGKASDSVIVDCVVNTGDSLTARLMGGGYVGGITGLQNSADLFNVHVMGTVGGSGSQAIGGVTGKYSGGKIQVARFEGTVASSGLGSAAREGTFMGTREPGFHFRYGTEEGADVAYLFTDSEAKLSAGICGSGIADDNRFTFDAHIGYWHRGDNSFTLVQGSHSRPQEDQYFYEELESGMLHVIDSEEGARKLWYQPDHFAPNALGRPARGYLVSVLQIDTAAGLQNYYDVASLTAKGSSAYSRELDKSHRGAVAAGDVVAVTTAPKNTPLEKYMMDGVPFYTGSNGRRQNCTYQAGGSYSFIMPEWDTEISAVYKKVAAGVRVTPEEFLFKVVQERSGDRKNPDTVTEVKDRSGRLIARYIDGEPDRETQIQDVRVEAVVDKNNDVADSRIAWSIDRDELVHLKRNGDEDAEGYTEKSASLSLNPEAGFFKDIINKVEKDQADHGYRYPIGDTIYGTNAGGTAILTAMTRPSASFEGKPLSANCKITVTFQIKDRTKVAAETAEFDKDGLEFLVTRTLTGDRKSPMESITVTEPQLLTAAFRPDYFDKKDISWTSEDPNVVRVDAGGFGTEGGHGEPQNRPEDYKNAAVYALKDAKWIRDIIASDNGLHQNDPYGARSGAGSRSTVITVTADDLLGNRQTASCPVTVRFRTADKTEILPEEVRLNHSQIEIPLMCVKAGDHLSETVEMKGFEEQTLTADVLPELEFLSLYEPFNRNVIWNSSDPSVSVQDGKLRPDPDGDWIKAAMEKPPYQGEKMVTITALAEERPEVRAICQVRLTFEMKCLDLDTDRMDFDLVLTKTGRRSKPVLTWDGDEGRKPGATVYPQGSENIVWRADGEVLEIGQDGTVKPVLDSSWITEAMKRRPYTGEINTVVKAFAGGMEMEMPVALKFRLVDKTYTSSGSGGSSGSSSSGSSGSGGTSSGGSQSSGVTASGEVKKLVEKPEGSVTGTWVQDGAGKWLFTGEGRTYREEWAYIHNPYAGTGQDETAWFRFDGNGHMMTGWYRDPVSGGWYYLNPVSDGTQGRMMTGWNWIGGKWYFLNPDGGCLFVNGVTPDGFTVDKNGAWVTDGIL